MAVKKDGRREKFDRQKVLGGLLKACETRPVGMGKLDVCERFVRLGEDLISFQDRPYVPDGSPPSQLQAMIYAQRHSERAFKPAYRSLAWT